MRNFLKRLLGLLKNPFKAKPNEMPCSSPEDCGTFTVVSPKKSCLKTEIEELCIQNLPFIESLTGSLSDYRKIELTKLHARVEERIKKYGPIWEKQREELDRTAPPRIYKPKEIVVNKNEKEILSKIDNILKQNTDESFKFYSIFNLIYKNRQKNIMVDLYE